LAKKRRVSGDRRKVDYSALFAQPGMLFTDGIVGEDSIGFKSNRDSAFSTTGDLWESVRLKTTYRPRTVTEADNQSDFYYLSLWYRKRGLYAKDETECKNFDDFLARLVASSSSGRGRIPRGVRLELANARTVPRPGYRDYASSWVWAPS